MSKVAEDMPSVEVGQSEQVRFFGQTLVAVGASLLECELDLDVDVAFQDGEVSAKEAEHPYIIISGLGDNFEQVSAGRGWCGTDKLHSNYYDTRQSES